jgi:hypothetical protein
MAMPNRRATLPPRFRGLQTDGAYDALARVRGGTASETELAVPPAPFCDRNGPQRTAQSRAVVSSTTGRGHPAP